MSGPSGSRDRYRRCSSSEAITWADSPHWGVGEGGGESEGEGEGEGGNREVGDVGKGKGIFGRMGLGIVKEVWGIVICVLRAGIGL